MNLVSHDVSVGSFGVAAAVVAVEIVVFVVAYTFTVKTTSNQSRNIKVTDTATSVSAAVDLEVVPSAVVLSCCCWNNSRNNTKSLKFYHNVVINSRQFERLIFGYRTCLNSGWLVQCSPPAVTSKPATIGFPFFLLPTSGGFCYKQTSISTL